MKRAWCGLAIVVAVSGCGNGGSQRGIHGKLTFLDDTEGATASTGIRHIAVGATINIDEYANAANVSEELTNVTSSNPGVLRVAGFGSTTFTLKAGKPGTSRITATTDSTQDSIDLRVEAIKSSELDFVSYDGWGRLAIINTPVPASFPEVAIAPDVQEHLVLSHWGTSGFQLTGFGATPISATPSGAVVPENDPDFFTLVAPNDVGSTLHFRAGKIDYDIDVVDPTRVSKLALSVYGPHTGATLGDPVGTALSIPVGKSSFRLDAWLADGRYLLASCPDFAVTSSVPGRAVLTQGPFPYGLQRDQRWFAVDFTSTGKTTLAVTCLGRTLSTDVTVEAASP